VGTENIWGATWGQQVFGGINKKFMGIISPIGLWLSDWGNNPRIFFIDAPEN